MALFGGTLYLVLREQLHDSLDEQLLEQAPSSSPRFRSRMPSRRLESTNRRADADGEFLCACSIPKLDRPRYGRSPAGVPLDRRHRGVSAGRETAYSTGLDDAARRSG